ncbi:MAG: hypothetical protein IKO72_09490 [Kiritimatiellae bacterium]|nr:hypothetical protein [Kiritimatiellia bacterium]
MIAKRVLACLALCAASAAHAANFTYTWTWTGNGTTPDWSNADNWSCSPAGASYSYPYTVDDNVVFDLDLGAGVVATSRLDVAVTLYGLVQKGATPVRLTSTDSGSLAFDLAEGAVRAVNGDGLVALYGSTLYLDAPILQHLRFDRWGDGTIVWGNTFTNGVNASVDCSTYLGGGGTNIFEGDFSFLLGRSGLHFGFNTPENIRLAELFQRDRAHVKTPALNFGSSRSAVSCIWHQDGDDTVTEIGGGADSATFAIGVNADTDAWSTSTYHLVRGTLTSTGKMVIGQHRPGRYIQDGGTATVSKVEAGSDTRSYGLFALNGGRFKYTSSSGFTPDLTGRVRFELNGGTLALPDSISIAGPLHFSGTPTIEIPSSKTLTLAYSPTVAPDTTITKTGAGTFTFYSDFPAVGTFVVQEGLAQIYSGGGFRFGLYGRANDYTPWRVTVKSGAEFVMKGSRNLIYQPLDLVVEDGGIFNLGDARIAAYCHSVSTSGVSLARGKYRFNKSTSGPFRSNTDCYVVIMYTWTGNGDGSTWSQAANWEGGAVPPSNADSYVDLSRATNIVFSSNMTIGGVFYCPNGANKKLKLYSESSILTIGATGYVPSCLVRPDAELIFDCEMRNSGHNILAGNGKFVYNRCIVGPNATPTSIAYLCVHCIDGTLVYRDVTQFIRYNNESTKDTCLSFWASGGETEGHVVFEGQNTDVEFNKFVWARGGYSAFNSVTQRDGAKLTITNLYINPHRNDNQLPYYWYLKGGSLTCIEGIYLNKSLTGENTTGDYLSWTRYGGGSFEMTGGTLTTPLMTSESWANWYWLDGGDVYVGAGGIQSTDSPTLRSTHKTLGGRNTTPSLQLGGATLHATADFTVTLDTAISGRGGAATIDTDGHDITFQSCAISGTGAWRKIGDGTLHLNGTNNFTGSLTVEAGSVSVGASAIVQAVPTRITLASADSLVLPAGTTWSVSSLSIGGVAVAAGSSQTFGSGTVTVVPPPDAGTGHWIGPASGGNWLSAANWSGSAVPNGETASATFDSASLQDGANLTFAENVTLGSLSIDVPGTVTLSASGDAYLTLTNGTITVSPVSTLVIDSMVVIGKAYKIDDVIDPAPVVIKGGGKIVFAGDVVNQDRSYNLNSHYIIRVPSPSTLEFRKLFWGIMMEARWASNSDWSTANLIAAPGALMNFASSPLADGWLTFVQTGGTVSFTNSVKLANSQARRYIHTMKSGELLVARGNTLQQGQGLASIRLEGGVVKSSGVGIPFEAGLSVTLAGDITFAQVDEATSSAFFCPFLGSGSIVQAGPGRAGFHGNMSGVPQWTVAGGTLELDCATAATNLTLSAGTLSIGAGADIPQTVELDMTHAGTLDIDFDGEFTVKRLRMNGHSRAAGLYDDGTRYDTSLAPYITGPGVLRVLEGYGPGLRLMIR